jgi:hypothetical protein
MVVATGPEEGESKDDEWNQKSTHVPWHLTFEISGGPHGRY